MYEDESDNDHDLHGGAAGSFASEGCAECADLDERDEDNWREIERVPDGFGGFLVYGG